MSAHSKKQDDVVTIGVHDLVLNDKCSVFDDENCEKVYVSVEFLNYPPEDLETPLSLVKGEPNKNYSFNFQKGFFRRIFLIFFLIHFFFSKDFPIHDQEKKQQLAQLVGPQSSGEYVLLNIYKNNNHILF